MGREVHMYRMKSLSKLTCRILIRIGKIGSLLLIIIVAVSLTWQVLFGSIVRPWEIHRAITSGCILIHKFEMLKNPTSAERSVEEVAFSRLALLDSKYIELETSAVIYGFYWRTYSENTNVATNSATLAEAQVVGFCAYS